MAKLVNIAGYIKRRFEEDGAPAKSTVRRWCENGDVPAKKIRGSWYIDLALEQSMSGNDLVDRVMEAS